MFYRSLNYFIILFMLALLSCTGVSTVDSERDSAPAEWMDVDKIPDAVPQPTQNSKYGNPSSYVVFGKRYHVMASAQGYKERGIASWYGQKFHGRRTSSGEPYDMHAMTAAHKSLPLPTYVRVTNLKNKRQVVLKVNDRGPFHDNRIIDLSHTAAVKLGIKSTGTGWVEVEVISPESNLMVASKSKVLSAAPPAVMDDTKASMQQSAVPPTLQDTAGLYLQAGAFTNKKNAQNLMHNLTQKLSSSGVAYQVNIFDLIKNDQPVFRVRIGPVKNAKDAQIISDSIVKNGFQKPLIIIE